jgi:hypothetical protein
MTHLRFLFALSLVSFAPLSVAQAGACPTCDSSDDCTSSEGPAFCVVHDDEVGCGALTTLCCPGQGCAVTDGRPSCEAAGTCTVIEDLTDGGLPDAGGADAGGTATDTGVGTDAGGPGIDAGTGTDAGTSTGGGGGGCRASAPSSSAAALVLAGLAAIALRRSTRR